VLLLLTRSDSELLLIVLTVLIVLIVLIVHTVFYLFPNIVHLFVQGHLLAPLGLGDLLSQCILYCLLTDIDIYELIHVTLHYNSNETERRSEISFTETFSDFDCWDAYLSVCVFVLVVK